MKVLKTGFVFVFSLLIASTVLNLLYHPDINKVLVAQHQAELQQFAAVRRLERQTGSSTARRESLAHRFDHWRHLLRPLRHSHRHSLSGGATA